MKAASSNAVSFPQNARESLATERTPWPGSGAITQNRRTAPPAHLTPRQLEVLALLCEGLPNKHICRRLNIATGTVKVHMSCILRELGVTSRLEAVVAASRRGLLGVPLLADSERTAAPVRVDHGGATAAGPAFGGRFHHAVAF